MKKKRLRSPAFQFYPNDWLSSSKIAVMTPAEEGGYVRLLCHAWSDPNCSLPDDDAHLAILSRLGEGWFNGGSTKIRACFETDPKRPHRIFNSRLRLERKKQLAWSLKSKRGGEVSGESRRYRAKGGSQMVEPNANQRATLQSSSSSSSSNESNTPPLPSGEAPAPEKKPRVRFVPPALAEVEAYWSEAQLQGSPQAYLDHFIGNGWRTKTGPVVVWKATARTWSRNESRFGGPQRSVGRSNNRPHIPGRYTPENIARMKAEAEAEMEAAR